MNPTHPSQPANTELSTLTSKTRILTAIRPSLQKWPTSCLVWMTLQYASLCIGLHWNLRDRRGNRCSKLLKIGPVGRMMCTCVNERQSVFPIACRYHAVGTLIPISKYVFRSLVQAQIRRHILSGKLWMKVMDNTGPVTSILYTLANTIIKRQHYGPVVVHDSVDQSK